ncbi:hypothetical protein FRB94_002918 [Tulasnella sp. JGI-2019a]|nr:hypothetical protein FRB93_013937 [Tulasnella sp. JGI-2019a]KAG9013390.1 hypothetical protein FRB94_002918 [Tulasnella sp. JGI-2019a]KAG9033736.1 hypothetical protein FRB95_014423 [Tulasnella sp. JGI-2019a]
MEWTDVDNGTQDHPEWTSTITLNVGTPGPTHFTGGPAPRKKDAHNLAAERALSKISPVS